MPSRFAIAAVAALIGCGDGGGFPDAPIEGPPQDPGTIALAWSLVDSSGSATTCGSAMAASVVLNVTKESTGEQFGQTFGCALGQAVTGSLATATYDLTIGLYDATNTLISMAPPQTGLVVMPDMTAHATAIVFTVP